MKTVIMAGGKGTRIAAVEAGVPKPMIQILNKPILEYQIEVLKEQGYKDIILVIGYLGNFIKEYFGDGSGISKSTGKPFGVGIRYIVEDQPLGTAGALSLLKSELKNEEDFLLINGDIIFDINIERFYQFHREKKGIASIFTHPNDHPYDSGIIVADQDKKVQLWLHKEDTRLWLQNRVNAGIHFISGTIYDKFDMFDAVKRLDLDRDILRLLITTGHLYAYDSPEYVKDIGTPDRLLSVSEDIKSNKMKLKNLGKKQKAIFLDRDGTLNKYVGFLKDISQLELIPGAADAVSRINKSGYLVIVITNQPVIARGDITFEELEVIHNKLETLLGYEGAYLDDIYFCPHHPHKGYENERPEYKIECNCRKPNPGLLIKAANEYNIDLKKSWMIGDGINDVLAGINVGCNAVLLRRDSNNEEQLEEAEKLAAEHQIFVFDDLLECVEHIIQGNMFG